MRVKRYERALENFRKAGVSRYIDARLADAHEFVKALPGPFDFVFSDADKEWYSQYFRDRPCCIGLAEQLS
jgi:caffeoyl-CoA O-methyltransferase